jgi:hypothetical protein
MPTLHVRRDRAERIRDWAYDNAFTLIFMASLSIVTWVIVVVANYIWA